MALILLLVVALSTSARAFVSNVRIVNRRSSLNMVATSKNTARAKAEEQKLDAFIMASEIEDNNRLIKLLMNDDVPEDSDDSLDDQLRTLQTGDIATSDNYWEGTVSRTKRNRLAAAQSKDVKKRIAVDENFYDLMNAGFDRVNEASISDEGDITDAVTSVELNLELTKSRSEQLVDMTKDRLERRKGLMRLVPPGLLKFVNYINSMYKKPSKTELGKNIFIGGFFSFVILSNNSARSAFMYFLIGNLIVTSALLTRNMPKVTKEPGQDKRRLVSWSGDAFKTAVSLVFGTTIISALVTAAATSLFPIAPGMKLRATMIAALSSSSFFTAFYEVFESKDKGGMRWRKSMEGNQESDAQKELAINEDGLLEGGKYQFSYDPSIEDFPPQKKYVDEGPGIGGVAGLDEAESQEHFVKWGIKRKEARRPEIIDAAPETPWVGSKKGMYVTKVPVWLSAAYTANVLKANNWRDMDKRFIKQAVEFERFEGDPSFRDKFPEWLKVFGNDVWEEKTSQSRKLARSFGTYRKTMWVIDKKVKLLPCDGADKEVDFKK